MTEEQTQETEIPEGAPPKQGKKGFPKVLVITLAVLGLAAAGYYFYGKTVLAHVQKQKTAKEQEKVEVGPIVPLEPFVINVLGNSANYVKISVAIELKNEKGVEQTKKMTPVIRDIMLSVLGTKAPEVFMDVNGRAAMKKELFEGINRLFADGGLKAIYITDIVMQ